MGPIFLGLCALTGLAVSIQIAVWLRWVAVVFRAGSRAAAVAAAPSVILVGIGLGALVAGRLADRARSPLRLVAILLLLLGAYAVFTPWLVALPAQAFVRAWRGGQAAHLLPVLGFALALVGLLPGTALVGALVPATMRVTTVIWSRLGRTLGYTGAAWVGGVAAGALAVGLGLLSAVGLALTASVWLAAVILLVAGGALALVPPGVPLRQEDGAGAVAGSGLRVPGPGSRPRRRVGRGRSAPRVRRRDRLSAPLRVVAAVGAGAAGLAAGGFGFLMRPLLAAQLGDRLASLAVALLVALVGATLGAALVGRLIDHRRDRTIWVAAALTVAGLAALWVAGWLPSIARVVPALAFGVRSRPVGEVLTFVVALMPVALCLGGAWPALCRVFVKSLDRVGTHTGVLAASWCAGGVAAAAVAGLAATPAVGCQGALLVCALVVSAVAVALVLVDYGLSTARRVLWLCAVTVATAAAALFQPAGVRHGSAAAGEHTILFYREGPGAVISVARWHDWWLIADGRQIDGTAPEWAAPAQALAHVPLVLCPAPRGVLILGERAGVTAAQVRAHAVARAEIVEPITDVHDAAALFRQIMPEPWQRPLELAYRRADPRGFVLGSDHYYDVVIINGLDPGSALGAHAYDREYLLACATHVRFGGLVALRVPLEGLDLAHLRLIIRTFRQVYPHAGLWWVPTQRREAMLVGSRTAMGLDATRAKERAARALPALAAAGGDDPLTLAGWQVTADEALDDLAGAGPVETAELPRLSLAAARARWSGRDRRADEVAVIEALRSARLASVQVRARLLGGDRAHARLAVIDRSWDELANGHVAESAGRQQGASRHYLAALAANPDDRAAHLLLTSVAGRERAGELVRGLAELVDETGPARRQLARLYRRLGLDDLGVAQLERAVELAPDDAAAWADLGQACADLGRDDRAETALVRALALDASAVLPRAALARLWMRQERWQPAADVWRRLSDEAEDDAVLRQAQAQLGACLVELGQTDEAIAHLEDARGRYPEDAAVLKALARAYERAGQLREAATAAETAARSAPRDHEAEELLHRLRQRLATQPAYPQSPPRP